MSIKCDNSKKLNVGLIYFKYPLFMQGSYIQEFVDELCVQNNKVKLISSPYPSQDFVKPNNLEIKWVTLFKWPIFGNILFNLQIVYVVLKSHFFADIDVINVISARGSISGFILSKLLQKPIICTIEIINNDKTDLANTLFNKLQKFLYKLPYSKIICWSEYYKNKYLIPWGIAEEKIKIIPSGIDIKRYNPDIDGSEIKNKYSPNDPLIVFAKPMYTYNRISAELLLESISMIDKPIHVLLGQGEEKDIIERKIAKLNLSDRVHFMPFVPITEIPKYLAASDIVVLSFAYPATTSRSLLESMSMKKPIVVTDVGEISNVLQNEHEALIVEPNKEKIAEAIKRLLNDTDLSKKIAENAHNAVIKKYSIEKVVKDTIQVYGKEI